MPETSKPILPLIKRVRGYRIYSQDNEKFLDFFQEGGKAILGSTPKGFANALKNEIEKGNYYDYPSGYEKKALRALHTLAGGSTFSTCFFTDKQEMVSFAASKEGKPYTLISGSESFSGRDKLSTCSIHSWYPFCGIPLGEFLGTRRYVMPVLPFPGSFAPALLLSAENNISHQFRLSPILLAGIAAAVYRLIQHIEKKPYAPWSMVSGTPAGRLWNISLPYLIPAYRQEQHDFVFKSFLENRILLQQDYSGISALPAEISEGERMLFLKTADKVLRGLS